MSSFFQLFIAATAFIFLMHQEPSSSNPQRVSNHFSLSLSLSLSADPGSAWTLDGLDDDVYEILEAQAIQINEQAKAKHRDVKVAGTTQIIG